MRLSAACAMAGFSKTITYPDVVDGCGVTWKNPSALLLAVAVAGGESSGNAWAYNINYPGTAQQSTDFGCWEINNMYDQQYFGPIATPLQFNWAIYYDNADMAYAVWQSARKTRILNKQPDVNDWLPWHAYSGGGYKAERYEGKSWLAWADFGVTQMESALKVPGATLDVIASVDNDPLVYWE
jgi:hypothetical protein